MYPYSRSVFLKTPALWIYIGLQYNLILWGLGRDNQISFFSVWRPKATRYSLHYATGDSSGPCSRTGQFSSEFKY